MRDTGIGTPQDKQHIDDTETANHSPMPSSFDALACTLRGKVLLVEDHPVNQDYELELVETLGVTTGLASNGIEALRQLANNAYDAILMDCHMPIMDGYDATTAIRKTEQRRPDPHYCLNSQCTRF